MSSSYMSCASSQKEKRTEKATELLRLHLERTGTMDALTGWIRNALEVPDEERTDDVLTHLKQHWSPYHGNIARRVIKNMMKGVQQELSAELEKRKELECNIAHLETMLLKKKVADLNISVNSLKAVVKKSPSLPSQFAPDVTVEEVNINQNSNTRQISCVSYQTVPPCSSKVAIMNAPMNSAFSLPAHLYLSAAPYAAGVKFN